MTLCSKDATQESFHTRRDIDCSPYCVDPESSGLAWNVDRTPFYDALEN